MDKLTEFYAELGVSPAVYEYGEKAIASLRERFEAIDKIAEYNQAKVLSALQKNRVSAACFVGRSFGREVSISLPVPIPIAPEETITISCPAFLRSLSVLQSSSTRRILSLYVGYANVDVPIFTTILILFDPFRSYILF